MHWRKNHQSDNSRLMSADLYDEEKSERMGRPCYASPIVVIERMAIEVLKSRDKPNGEGRNVAYFRGYPKPLGLNVTNAETLTMLSGSPDVNRWPGLKIQLWVDPMARYPSGQTGPAIRIRPELPEEPAGATPPPAPSPATRDRLDQEHAQRLEGAGAGGTGT